MGVANAGQESANRYLARDLGPRRRACQTRGGGTGPHDGGEERAGFAAFEDVWDARAPLGRDVDDPEPVAQACVALLSDWFPKTTGQVVHVDGGFSAVDV
jgi:enoyl ACP reductase